MKLKIKCLPKLVIAIMLLLTASNTTIFSQEIGLKTNMLYGTIAKTPNLGVEIGISNKSTIDITGGYNPWNFNGKKNNNKKMVHWLGNVEYRYWFCEKFNGHFIGIHGLGGQFNISGYNLPLLLGKDSKSYRFEGSVLGAGISYGYQFVLSKNWNAEANIGFGYAHLNYDKYECKKCGDKLGHFGRNYWGPTKAALSVIYVF